MNWGQKLQQLEVFRQRFPRRLFTEQTFCIRLWEEVSITDDGDVYPCCHNLPWKLGNLNEGTLEDIWNGVRTRAARNLSLHNGLYCHNRCTLLDEHERSEIATDEHKGICDYRQLRRIKISFGELCNLACIMCDQNHRSRKQLSLDMLKRRIDWTHFQEIEFQGGEPLAMKECKDAYIWLTEEMGKKVNFLTNGTLISTLWAKRIAKGSTWLYVSINGSTKETFEIVNIGGKLDKIKRNVHRVLDAREKVSSDIELVGHFTIVPENIMEATAFPALGAEMGFDRVEFGFDLSQIPKWLKTHPQEASRLRCDFEQIITNPPVPVRDHRLRYLGLLG